MTKHTPAPWIMGNEGDIVGWPELSGHGEFVAIGGGLEGIKINNPADRDLILAAPDMYEALGRVLDFTVSSELREIVCNALKKAQGDQ